MVTQIDYNLGKVWRFVVAVGQYFSCFIRMRLLPQFLPRMGAGRNIDLLSVFLSVFLF